MDRICKLDILAPAQAELEEIARVHMALSGPRSAQEITDKIYDAMEQLTRFPLSGPPVRDEVVYHIAHGATDYPKLFRTSYF